MSKSGRRHLTTLIAVIIALIGIGLLAYPHIRFFLSDLEQTYVIQNYDHTLSEKKMEEIQKEGERAHSYNASLATSKLYDPFATSKATMDEEYRSILDIGDDGVMGYIEISKIGVDIPIFHGVAAGTLEKGIGHLEGSSLPVGGAGTHTILTGHTGLNTAKLFTDLDKLEKGDEFYLHVLGEVLAYEVISIRVVEPHDVASLVTVEGEDLATLITCTPYGINSHRLLVQGERVDYDPEKTTSAASPIPSDFYLGAAVVFLFVTGVIVVLFMRQRKRGMNRR